MERCARRGIFTACLFLVGRYLIGLYISSTAAGSPYGAAGSLIVILLWVYYTAAILYLGAEFTRTYAIFKGRRIQPSEFAVFVEQREIERDTAPVTAALHKTVIEAPEQKPLSS